MKVRMERIRVKLGFAGMFVVDSVGRSGRLALFWKETDELEIQNYSKRHINAIVKQDGGDYFCKLTGCYGHSNWNHRHESWALLKHLKLFAPNPWLCVGDFNKIIDQSEKNGVALRKEGQMKQFREALEDCNVSDLDFIGSKYTWNNGRQDDGFGGTLFRP
jgi:hypothetical protein